MESPEFLSTIAGATGKPFLRGNSLKVLNNGDEFYPSMLDAITERSLDHRRGLHLLGGRDRDEFARALASGRRPACASKSCSTRGSASIGTGSSDARDGGCQIAWYNPLRWYTLGRYNNLTHRKSLIIDGRVGFTGGAGIADKWLGHARIWITGETFRFGSKDPR